ncbi:hypothetical protein MTX20_08715 [Bradyrhizobium sp. ISRA435]|nr:hypothetical protein MTX20_08715 [Bradyrhizobium sp. ISRA435]
MFDADEVKALSRLSARLTEAATLSTVVGRSAISGITSALGLIQVAAIAVGRSGVVIGTNGQADACLGDDFAIRNNRLTLRDRQANADLTRLIDQLDHTSDLLTVPSSPIVVRRLDRRPIVIQMQPVPPAARSPFLGARAILLIRDLEGSVAFDQALLAATFELTPAQARLAARLARGDSVEDAARGGRRCARHRPQPAQVDLPEDRHAPAGGARRAAAQGEVSAPPGAALPRARTRGDPRPCEARSQSSSSL